jgi:phage terminase large subunit-like protein
VADLIAPTFESYPEAATSAGIDAVELAASAGLILDPWQEYALDRILAEDGSGRPAAFEAALIVPRQNGKGSVLEALSLYWLFVADVPLILHSAHEFKALDVQTPILAARGWTTMGELVDGDQVYAPDGALTEITAHPVREGRPCWRLTFDDGQTIVADSEHLWAVEDVRSGRPMSRVMTTAQIVEAGVDVVSPRAGRVRRTYNFRTALPAPLAGLHDAELPVDPWLLGFWLGDGSTSKGELTVGIEDLDYVLGRLAALGETWSLREDPRTNGRVWAVTVKGLRARLASTGALHGKHIPERYLVASEAQRRELLAGVMDSDGTVSAHQMAVTMIHERLMGDVASLARSLGYKASLREFRARLNGADAGPMWRVQMTASTDSGPFGLPRKAALVRARKGGTTRAHYNAIVAVEPVETRPTRCITVAHESGRYLAGRGFLVTHNTAAEGFRRLRTLIQGAPKLADRVDKVTTAAGNEAIELVSGQRLRYVARSKGSGRGFTGGKVILDEAYALEDEEMAALLPTMATQADAQVVYTSSAGMSSSSQLRSVRDRGRKGGDPSLCYLEWGGRPIDCATRQCVHDLADDACSLNERDRWREANPGWEIRIPRSFITKERRALTPEAFARERCGVWDESLGESPIPMAGWTACADLESKRSGQVVFGVDVSPSLRSAAIAVAGWRSDGLAHGEIAKHEPGVDWLVAELARMVKAHRPVAVVGHGTAQLKALVPSLEAAGVTVDLLTDGDMAAACSQLQSEVAEGGFRHLGDPILADALGNAASKPVGDGGWVWRRKGSEGDITPLVALNAARWGLQTVPKAPVPLIAWR